MWDILLPTPVFFSLLPLLSSAAGLRRPFPILVPLLLSLRPRRLLYGSRLLARPLEFRTPLLCGGDLRRGACLAFFPLLPLRRSRRRLFHLLSRCLHPGGNLFLLLDRRQYPLFSRALKVLADRLGARLVTIVLTS